MENLTLEIADTAVEKQSTRFRELVEKRRVLLERIERTESAKHSVSERIYRKVRTEYEAQVRTLEEELEPLALALDKGRISIERDINGVDAEIEELNEALEELAFRHCVGEFDESTFEDSRAPLETKRDRLLQRREELANMLRRIGGPDTAPRPSQSERAQDRPAYQGPQREEGAGPARAVSTEAHAHAEEAHLDPAARSAILNELDHAPAETHDGAADPGRVSTEADTDSDEELFGSTGQGPDYPATNADMTQKSAKATEAFVDPTEWIGEFVGDETGDAGTANEQPDHAATPSASPSSKALYDDTLSADQPDGGAPDPLANLADPFDEMAEAIKPSASQNTGNRYDAGSPAGLPILIIGSGPGAGKRLPLLPMTMTLGREVDNNIELKDKDVARYHARISYEAGRYVIQDLEGSSGTFVNEKQVTRAALSVGDVIRVGGTELRLDIG